MTDLASKIQTILNARITFSLSQIEPLHLLLASLSVLSIALYVLYKYCNKPF